MYVSVSFGVSCILFFDITKSGLCSTIVNREGVLMMCTPINCVTAHEHLSFFSLSFRRPCFTEEDASSSPILPEVCEGRHLAVRPLHHHLSVPFLPEGAGLPPAPSGPESHGVSGSCCLRLLHPSLSPGEQVGKLFLQCLTLRYSFSV